ncbi:MAG: radical SAM protein [Deltaproteobacteria bacterium]|nr:radical SAM protein [Deltaproteobacteria bacterium]
MLRSGELEARVEALLATLSPCVACPLDCGVDRLADGIGRCFVGRHAVVSSWTPHFGEEPVLSGTRGVGNVFFGQCNLRCVYCQNWQISQQPKRPTIGRALSPEQLADVYLQLEAQGCHALGWVSPSHVVPQAVEALLIAARRGLSLPIVYNTNAYDALPVLRLLEGIVDLWLPDLKYADAAAGLEYSKVEDYPDHARAAVLEMARQVGTQVHLDPDGLAFRGLIVRHLVLPNEVAGSESTLRWLRDALGQGVHVSAMCQYFPTHRAEGRESRHPLLTRAIRPREYDEVLELLTEIGLVEGWSQDLDVAPEYYRPDFSDAARPFADIADFNAPGSSPR